MEEFIFNAIIKSGDIILFFMEQLVLIGGTILLGIFLVTGDKKCITKLMWFWTIWLILNGVFGKL